MPVTVRFFAAARAAAGREEVQLASVADLSGALAAVASPSLDAVLANCSFLLNGYAEADRAAPLADGDVVDVLPPFAGG